MGRLSDALILGGDHDLFDITRNYHGGNRESIAAKQLNVSQAKQQRERIMLLARQRAEHGLTCDEAEQTLNLPHQSCSARFSELKRDGLLVPSNITRKTRNGGEARVMVARANAPI